MGTTVVALWLHGGQAHWAHVGDSRLYRLRDGELRALTLDHSPVGDLVRIGRIATGFHIVQHLAIGADLCAAARPMMFALGCIQALRCNSNHCPVGIATQDPGLVRGLDVTDKAARVHRFHHATVHAALSSDSTSSLLNNNATLVHPPIALSSPRPGQP